MSVFTDAIRVLEERGWTQGEAIDEQGRVCVLGALSVAAGHGGYWNEADAGVLARVLGRPVYNVRPNDGRGIAAWNDDPHITVEDVVLALKRAHELAEAE